MLNKKELINALAEYFKNNVETWGYELEYLDLEIGLFEEVDKWKPMDMFDMYFYESKEVDGLTDDEVVKEYDGDKNNFNFNDDYFRINVYGLESCKYPDYSDCLVNHYVYDDIIEAYVNVAMDDKYFWESIPDEVKDIISRYSIKAA